MVSIFKQIKQSRLGSLCLLILVNLAILLLLLVFAELSYRIYLDGFPQAFVKMIRNWDVPYSNLGTANWVIYDNKLGYRLNPEREGINSLSIKNEEITTPKPPGIFRIMYLGDSIPWAKNGFVEGTRDLLKKRGHYEVINAAVPGYTAYQEVLFYKHYLAAAYPDLVIWTYCLNDNHKFLHRFDEKGRMLATDEAAQSLKINSAFDKFIGQSYLLSLLRMHLLASPHDSSREKFRWEKNSHVSIAWKDYSWQNYEQYLRQLKAMLRGQKSKLMIIIFPFEPQLEYHDDSGRHDYVLKPQRRLMQLCEKHGIPCLDLYPVFSRLYSEGYKLYKDRIHLNEEGHAVTADAVIEFLYQHRLLPAEQ